MNFVLDIDKYVNSRPGLERTLRLFLERSNVILVAPTGYGKTLLSIKLINKAIDNNISAGLIHVAPYRALVREIYLEKFSHYPDVGWQMHGELGFDKDLESKSPYYLKKLVITTLDSFVYNLYRIPVAEMRKILAGKSSGHYYPVLASILTSTVVFDEAHFYLSDSSGDSSESLQALYAALDYLSHVRVPIMIETATMRSDYVYSIVNLLEGKKYKVKVVYVGSAQMNELQDKLGFKLEIIKDPDFSNEHSFNWITKLVDEKQAIQTAVEICKSEPVLFIRNTVKKAVETYQELKGKCNNTVLIHGLLSEEDRKKALEVAKDIIKHEKGGVVVATQVVEAGVEIGGSVLITDTAPIENLAQRAGRLCRETYGYAKICKESGAYVYIVKVDNAVPYPKEAVQSTMELVNVVLKNEEKIDWRLLESRRGYISFAKLLERVNIASNKISTALYLYEDYLESDADSQQLVELMKSYNLRLLDRSYMITVVIPKNNIILEKLRKEGMNLDHVKDFTLYFEIVTVDARRLFMYDSKEGVKNLCLECSDLYPLLLVIERERVESEQRFRFKLRIKPATGNLKKITDKLKQGHPFALYDLLKPKDESSIAFEVYLLAKPKCYEKGVGLKIWE